MANEYRLLTDSSCDMPASYLEENGIITMQLYVTIDGETCPDNQLDPKVFYDKVRQGGKPYTAQVNVEDAVNFFEPILQQGLDILYVAFSSGLSGTCNSGQVAAVEMRQKYPERKIVVIDTLCASMGQGLLVYKANELMQAGKSLDEVAGWVTDHIQKVAHYVTVDDLMHLHRGGRVSKTSAVVGSVLGIKPIIHVDSEGKLQMIDKARGRKQSLDTVVKLLQQAVGSAENDILFVSHADCEEDAKYVAELVRKEMGVEKSMINWIGPVIGAHTGPGGIALFLLSEHR